MEIHAASSSSSAIHVTREEEEEHEGGVAPLPQQPSWSKAECAALQTRDERLLSIDGGVAQSDSSCCCCSTVTCDGCQTFDSDSAVELLDGVRGGEPTTECPQVFGSLQDVEGGEEGSIARSHSSPALAKGCLPAAYPSSVCVKDRSVEVEELHSENGLFRFVLQPDRTLVLYMGDDDLWAIYLAPRARERANTTTTVRLILQKDGNLVAIDSSFRQVWETNTANKAPGPYTLTMEDNGNCVLCAEGGVHLWATRTARWG